MFYMIPVRDCTRPHPFADLFGLSEEEIIRKLADRLKNVLPAVDIIPGPVP